MNNATIPLSIRPAAAHRGHLMGGSSVGLKPEVRNKVLARDNHTCSYCGFRAEKYQEVRPRDHLSTARTDRPEDWVTTCHMCDQCLSLERVGMMGEGILIWMPELTQAEVNHMIRSFYISRTGSRAEMVEAAKKGIDALRGRRDEAKRLLGTDDPMILAAVMADFFQPDQFGEINAKIAGIRLLSLDRRMQRTRTGEVDRFPEMLSYWKATVPAYTAV